YSLPEDSFWCCVGTGMENHAKYGDSIYFHDANQLYVNLFIPSEVEWKEKGVTLRQDTKFPEDGLTTLTVRCKGSVKFALRIRYPSWAAQPIKARMTGEEKEVRARADDRAKLRSMKIRVKGKLEEIRGVPGT